MDGNNRGCLPDGRNAKWKCSGENPCQSEEGILAWDRQLSLGQWQWTRRDLWQPREIQRGRRGSNEDKTPQGTWLGAARLRLCYAGPLAGRQKSGI